MDERTRHTYLKAMGIQLWSARVVLPNSKPGPQRRLIEPTRDVDDRNSMRKSDETAVRAKAGIAGVPSGKADTVSNGDNRPPPAVMAGATPFQICLFHSEPGNCVICEVPVQLSELDAGRRRLVEDICRALGSETNKNTVVYQQWPMVRNRNVTQSDTDAQVVIQEKLDKRIRAGATKVVIMGEVAARYLPVESRTLKYRENRTADNTVVAAVTVGIDELLQDPIQKRDLWGKLESLLQTDQADGQR